jgi:two-component system chemotaxis response regulator CheY
MDILQHYNINRFLSFIPSIKKNVDEWRIIEVSLTGKSHHNIAFIAKKLQALFGDKDGVIFICNSRDILALVQTGNAANTANLSKEINETMPEHSCTASAGKATAEGLLTIQVKLQERDEEEIKQVSHLFKARQQRSNNVIMVADDDNFMRSVIAKTFVDRAHVLAIDETIDIVEAYLEHLPDILFLDIHLPKISGIQLLEEILNFDDSAHIIIISSDSRKDNVLDAKKLGAKGFLAKPLNKEKLESHYHNCATISA